MYEHERTASRIRLKVESLSALKFLKVNGPRPIAFNPSPHAEHWLKDGHHAASDAPTGPTGKPTKEKRSQSAIHSIFM